MVLEVPPLVAHQKYFASDKADAQTANAVQIFGGSGYIRGFEVERLYSNAKITQIYKDTNQIQRTIIARELMKSSAWRFCLVTIRPDGPLCAMSRRCRQTDAHARGL